MGSIPIARSILRLAQDVSGREIGVNTLILWETGGNRRRFGGGHLSSHIPKLPHYSHVQSHAASSKNNVCDSHTLCAAAVRRSTLLPEVPTIAEAGVAGFDFPIWYGIWAPAGTPTGVVDKLSKDIARAVAGPDLRDWIAKHGGEPMSMTQPEFARFVQSESEGAARLIKAVGIKP